MKRIDARTITFEEEAHTYTDDLGVRYATATETVNSFFKKFDADASIASSRRTNPGKYAGMTDDEIKAQWKGTAVWGTKMHAGIEYLFKAAIDADSVLDKEELLRLTSELVTTRKAPLDKWPLTPEDTEFLLPEFEQFLAFAQAEEFRKYCHSEFCVFSPSRVIAGTFDLATYDDEGNCTIYDWKRISVISKYGYGKKGFGILAHLDDSKHNHYRVQLNLYKTLLEENYTLPGGVRPQVREMKLISLHRDKLSFEIQNVVPLPEVKRIFSRKCVLLDLNGVIGLKCEKGQGRVSLRRYDFEPRPEIEQFVNKLKERYVVGIYSSCRRANILACLSSVSEDFHKQFTHILDQEYCVLTQLPSGDIFKKDLTRFYTETHRDSSSVVLVEHELEKIVPGTSVALVEEWGGGESPSFEHLLGAITACAL